MSVLKNYGTIPWNELGKEENIGDIISRKNSFNLRFNGFYEILTLFLLQIFCLVACMIYFSIL